MCCLILIIATVIADATNASKVHRIHSLDDYDVAYTSIIG